jgi:hypothetical protein
MLGLELSNHPAMFPVSLVRIIQGEYATMGAFLAAYLLPFVPRKIIS